MSDSSTIEDRAIKWVEEALDLRHGSAGDEDGPLKIVSIEDGSNTVAHELMRVRQRIDRVDYIRTQAALLKSSLRAKKAETDFKAETKFSEAVSARDRVKHEYASALSVKSNATLDSFNELREAHEAKMLIEMVRECYDIIDSIARQLDAIRNDLRIMLRTLQFQSTLDS